MAWALVGVIVGTWLARSIGTRLRGDTFDRVDVLSLVIMTVTLGGVATWLFLRKT